MDHSEPTLTPVPGMRAELELEALLSVPTDFQKALRIMRMLTPAANAPLAVVPRRDGTDDAIAGHEPRD